MHLFEKIKIKRKILLLKDLKTTKNKIGKYMICNLN